MATVDNNQSAERVEADSPLTSRPIRVMFVGWTLTNGGAERVVSTLLRHLNRQRFEPSLCLLQGNATYPIPTDVQATELGHRGPLTYLATIRKLSKHIRQNQPDIVFSNIGTANIVAGEAIRVCSRPPRWVARIGLHPQRDFRGWQRMLFHSWQRRVYRWADAVVVNSQRLTQDIDTYFPTVAGRVSTILNPTDFAEIDRLAAQRPAHPANSGKPIVLSAGRLHPAKRPDLLLQAFALVRSKIDAELWICGDGPLRKQVEKEIRRLSLSDSVHLLGFCRNPYSLMKQAQVFALTSDSEGLPNALIEAQGLGIPAVSTCCPSGPDEIIEDGRTGYLVPMGDACAIADRISTILGDSSLRQEMSRHSHNRAKECFDAASRTIEFASVFTGTLDGGSKTS